ncbi:hypothetical protein FBQ99_08170 [Chloroflexi bacterium CFX2]|nr:hypothetical protein [Chloroflexi bacterium CFX2]
MIIVCLRLQIAHSPGAAQFVTAPGITAGFEKPRSASLDTASIPQIITANQAKAVTEESRLAEAARDAQGKR